MASWATVGFNIGFRSIRRAYDGSERTFAEEIEAIDRQARNFQKDVDAGKAQWEEEDEETGAYYNHGEQLGELQWESEESQRLIREAFCLVLYHFWEKEACRNLSLSRYNQTEVFEAARIDQAFDVKESEIDKLRRIANCIKHDNGADLHREFPQMFDPTLVPRSAGSGGWHSAMRLTQVDVEAAFSAVKASGPKSPRSTSRPDE